MPEINDLLKKANNPKEFFEYLHHHWLEERTTETQRAQLVPLLIELNQTKGVDLCDLGCKAIHDGFPVFEVTDIFEEVLPSIDLKTESLIQLLEMLYEGSKNDLAAYLQYKPIKELTATQPEYARDLVDKLIKIDRPFIIGYLSNLLLALSIGQEETVHEELAVVSSHKSTNVIIGIINTLGNFNYEIEAGPKLLQQTFEIFDALEARNDEAISASLCHAYGQLLDISDLAPEKLHFLAKKNQISIDHALSRILFLKAEKHGNKDWFEKLLLQLARTLPEYKGILDNLDYALASLIRKKANWDLAEKFLLDWLQKADGYKPSEEKLADFYGSTFMAYSNDRTRLQKFLTKLFNQDDFKAHNAAHELINYCNAHKLEPLKLDTQELKKLDSTDLLYIARKILGYVIDSKTQCSLTFSLLEKSPRNKNLQGLVYKVFIDHIGPNYPGSTINFLKEQIRSSKSKIKHKLAKTVIEQIEGEQNARASLSNIKEIIPPSIHSHRVLLEENKIMRKAMREAQMGGIASLFTQVHLKYGSGSFSYFNGDYGPINKLGSYKTDMELPFSEIMHPVHAAIERTGFRMAKRGQ